MALAVEHLPLTLRPDPARTMLRPFVPAEGMLTAPGTYRHREGVLARLASLNDAEVRSELAIITDRLAPRHSNLQEVLDRRLVEMAAIYPALATLSPERRQIVGAYFTEEYAFAATALFNPSIVAHPDQSGLPDGALRFILSLRAIGEGHISSITFRTGLLAKDGTVALDPITGTPLSPRAENIPGGDADDPGVRLSCPHEQDLQNAVLFPITHRQRHGLEDLRMVRFEDPPLSPVYLGTYTAVSGEAIRQELLRTTDFRSFDLSALRGPFSATKGMAPFPRRIGGRYAMLGRQDHESLWLLYSVDLYHWADGVRIAIPSAPWELIQLGNCSPPIEIPEGWLVITHGVGAIRRYSIGAMLLKKDDPSVVLGRLTTPLLSSDTANWFGYVPNVVYSCGAIVHQGWLNLPYGVSDTFTTMARFRVADLVNAMI